MALDNWEIDRSHSGIHFSVRHMVISRIRGQFARWSGSIVAEGGNFSQGRVSIAIDAESIDTGVADRDSHLKSADFLDVASHREITFAGHRVEQLSGGELRVAGDLTIRGVTRPVVLDVEYAGCTKDPWGSQRAGFTAKTSIDRKDFGLVWNQVLEAGGVMVGDRVEIEAEIEAVKQTAVKAA